MLARPSWLTGSFKSSIFFLTFSNCYQFLRAGYRNLSLLSLTYIPLFWNWESSWIGQHEKSQGLTSLSCTVVDESLELESEATWNQSLLLKTEKNLVTVDHIKLLMLCRKYLLFLTRIAFREKEFNLYMKKTIC